MTIEQHSLLYSAFFKEQVGLVRYGTIGVWAHLIFPLPFIGKRKGLPFLLCFFCYFDPRFLSFAVLVNATEMGSYSSVLWIKANQDYRSLVSRHYY
jgi:hypothetical protein